MNKRYWFLQDRILTSSEMKVANISPLRATSLGRCASLRGAIRAAAKLPPQPAAAVISHNVRIACDSGSGARWRLSGEQLDRLRRGATLVISDSLGTFTIGYSRIAPKPAACDQSVQRQ